MEQVEITTIAKQCDEDDEDAKPCKDGPCPSAHVTTDKLILQGYKLAEGLRTQMNFPENEDAVEMPLETGRALVKQMAEQLGLL